METVTIRVRPDQRDHIDTLKVHPRETVGDVLDRVFELVELLDPDGKMLRSTVPNGREAQEQR